MLQEGGSKLVNGLDITRIVGHAVFHFSSFVTFPSTHPLDVSIGCKYFSSVHPEACFNIHSYMDSAGDLVYPVFESKMPLIYDQDILRMVQLFTKPYERNYKSISDDEAYAALNEYLQHQN